MNSISIGLSTALRLFQTVPANGSCTEDVTTGILSGRQYSAELSQLAAAEHQLTCLAGDALPDAFPEIPEPPRRADGKIDYDKISNESLAALLKAFSQRRLALLWETSRFTLSQEIAKRRAKQQCDGTTGENVFGGRPYQYKRPSKLKLFELLWTMPATHIAKDIGCSQATILGWAKEDGLKGPGHRYWQRKNNGIRVEVPPEIKALYMKLRAEATPEEQLGEIPEVFRTSETQTATELKKPVDMGGVSENPTEPATASESDRATESSSLNRRRRSYIILKISKGDLLEQRWLKPATRVAEELNISHSALLQKCRDLGLGPFLPPEEHWRSRKSGDPIIIPKDIQRVIAQLRAESVGACEEMLVVIGEQLTANSIVAAQDRALQLAPAEPIPGGLDYRNVRRVPLPGNHRQVLASLGAKPCIEIGPFTRAPQRWRHGTSAIRVNLPILARRCPVMDMRNLCAPARGRPSPPEAPSSCGPNIYTGSADFPDHYSPLIPAHCRGP
jgi:hypothetical protein